MDHPRIGERVYVRPSNPAVRVQRGEVEIMDLAGLRRTYA